MRKGAL